MCLPPATQPMSTTGREADLIANWVELALGDTDTDAYIAGGTNVNALQHTLCIDAQIIDRHRITRGGSVAWSDSATGKEWWASFSSSVLVQNATHHQRLIKTSLGYLGLPNANREQGVHRVR